MLFTRSTDFETACYVSRTTNVEKYVKYWEISFDADDFIVYIERCIIDDSYEDFYYTR